MQRLRPDIEKSEGLRRVATYISTAVTIFNVIVIDVNTMLCPINVNSNTIELTVHTSCDCILDLLCVKIYVHL